MNGARDWRGAEPECAPGDWGGRGSRRDQRRGGVGTQSCCLHCTAPGCAGHRECPPGQTDPVRDQAGGCSLGRGQQVSPSM